MSEKDLASCFDLILFNPALCDSVRDVADGLEITLRRYQRRDMGYYWDVEDSRELLPNSTTAQTSVQDVAWRLVAKACQYYFRNLPTEIIREVLVTFRADHAFRKEALRRYTKTWDERRDGNLVAAEPDTMTRRYNRAHGIDSTPTAHNPRDFDIDTLLRSEEGCKRLAIELAAILMEMIEKKIFTVGVELNFLDFQEVAPSSAFCHNPEMVIKRLKNPDYEPTEFERLKYFAENGQVAFQNMTTMSAMDTKARILSQDDFVIANATRFNNLKAYFPSAAEKYAKLLAEMDSTEVKVGTELDGMRV